MASVGGTDTGSQVRPVATLGAAVVAAIAIVVVARMVFSSAASAMVGAIGPVGAEAVFTVILFGALLAVAWIGMRLDGVRPGLLGRAPALRAASGAAIGLVALLASTALALLAATVTEGTGESQGGVAIVIGTATILFQASTEEIYFRGWLQPVLVRHWARAAGLLIASVGFAALHIAGGARTPLTLVNLLLGGLLFGLLALRSGGLAAPIAAHAAYNWAEQILLGLDPNPGTGSFGALFDYDLAGSAWWGGSDEGLNASLAVSFVLLAIVLPLAAWRRRGPAPTPLARPG
jgi:membrane protease YdiL (CAAX protease family)